MDAHGFTPQFFHFLALLTTLYQTVFSSYVKLKWHVAIESRDAKFLA